MTGVVSSADRERHAPVAQGARGIDLGRACKRARRFVVIERPHQSHALIEYCCASAALVVTVR
jgi:hypothetical protein